MFYYVSVWLGLCFRGKVRGGCWHASSGFSQKEPRKTTGSSRGLFRHWWFWRPKIVGRVGRATTQARGNKQLLSSKCYYSLAYIIKQWDKHALLKNKGLGKGVYTSPMGSTLYTLSTSIYSNPLSFTLNFFSLLMRDSCTQMLRNKNTSVCCWVFVRRISGAKGVQGRK